MQAKMEEKMFQFDVIPHILIQVQSYALTIALNIQVKV